MFDDHEASPVRNSSIAAVNATVALPLILALAALACKEPAATWSRFRGPNGSGVTETTGLPAELGPERNVLWKTDLPPGHSSPVLSSRHLFVTAFEEDRLLTLCLDRSDGRIVWRREAPRSRSEKLDNRNSPASPSPVTDGDRVYVFFPDFGLLAYAADGSELWRVPLGPFDNIYGMGASPIVVDDFVVLLCDQSTGSFIAAFDKLSGRLRWKTERPEAKSGHSTPVVYQPPSGEVRIVVPGSFMLTSYSVASGNRLSWVRGLSFEMKSTPVLDGDRVFINGYGFPENQPDQRITVPPFAQALAAHDSDGNQLLSRTELPDGPAKSWFVFPDLNGDQFLDGDEWSYYQASMATSNGMLAIRLGGRGDMTDSNLLWQYHRAVPQLPSPLLYKGLLYMINDGGIVTAFAPATGEVINRGRLVDGVDQYYASPVAADDKIYLVSLGGVVTVIKPDGSLDVLATNELGDLCYATPAIADGRIYLRTRASLFCFGIDQRI